jgi:hypothetical protein
MMIWCWKPVLACAPTEGTEGAAMQGAGCLRVAKESASTGSYLAIGSQGNNISHQRQ